MIEIKTILCPIDFSDHSRRALDHAVTIARWYESTITVLHVCPTVPPAAFGLESPPPRGAILTPAERERLTTAMARFVEASNTPEIPIEIVIGQSSATASEILKEASAMRADLLVIGTHGRSGFDRLVLGSVTEKVLRKANCPVLTVPAHAPETLAVTPVLFKRIVCPIDFSDSSMHALNYAMSLAQEADARLTVLHVMQDDLEVEAPEMYATVIADRRLTVTDYRNRCEQYSQERLRTAVPDTVRAVSYGRDDARDRQAASRDPAGRHRAAGRPHCDGGAGTQRGRFDDLRIDHAARRTSSHLSGAHDPQGVIAGVGRGATMIRVAHVLCPVDFSADLAACARSCCRHRSLVPGSADTAVRVCEPPHDGSSAAGARGR